MCFDKTKCFTAAMILTSIVEASSDIYLPCIINLIEYFKVPIATVNLTLSLNLVGLGISSLFYGPFSDRYGRKSAILLGGLIFLIGSLGACFAHSIGILCFWRFIQGLGGGAALPIGQAIVKDVYQGKDVAIMLSRSQMVIALSPLLGPVIGSYIAHFYDWHLVFISSFIAGGVALMLSAMWIPSVLPINREISGMSYKIFYNLPFIKYSLAQLLIIFWLWAEVSIMPFVFIGTYNLPKAYFGFYSLMSVLVYMSGLVLNQSLLAKIHIKKVAIIGIYLSLIGSINLILGQLLLNLSPFIIVLLKTPASLGLGLILGNLTALSMECLTEGNSGWAMSLLSCMSMIFGSAGAFLIGYLYTGTLIPLVCIMLVCCIIAFYLTSN